MVSPLHSPVCALGHASGAVPSGMSGAAVAWPLPDGSVSGLRGEQAAGFVLSADVLSFLSGSERHWLVG